MKIITIALLFQFLLSCWPQVNIITLRIKSIIKIILVVYCIKIMYFIGNMATGQNSHSLGFDDLYTLQQGFFFKCDQNMTSLYNRLYRHIGIGL